MYSGAGRTLMDARAPGYLDTAKGRVALISVDSSFEYGEFLQVQMASDPHGGVPGRPGVNGLRFDLTYELDGQAFDQLGAIHRALGLHREGLEIAHRPPYPDADQFMFRGALIRRSNSTRVRTSCRPGDLEEVLRWIRNARAQADQVLVSHHSHLAAGETWELPVDFVVEFAHAAIDAGADAYIGHGYSSKGVEIYRDRPILYDLGNFAEQDASARRHPADAYEHWGLDPKATPGDFADARQRQPPAGSEAAEVRENVRGQWVNALADFTFDGGRLTDLRLHPFAPLQGDLPRHHRGTPQLLHGEAAEAVIARFRDASLPFGTTIETRDGIGHVRLS